MEKVEESELAALPDGTSLRRNVFFKGGGHTEAVGRLDATRKD